MQPAKSITFKRIEQGTYPEWGFRPNVPMFPMSMNFVLLNGGMGDYICWMPAIKWIATHCTWIKGTIVGPNYLRELAEYWMKDFPTWEYNLYEDTRDKPENDQLPFRGPVVLQHQSLNATGAHLLTCGWVYMANQEKAPSPEWDRYLPIEKDFLATVPLPVESRVLDKQKYAIITTGITTESRRVPGKYWNPIIEHIRS